MWVLLSAIYLIVVAINVSSTFPNLKSIDQWSVYDKMRPESKEKLVYEKAGLEMFEIIPPLHHDFMRGVTTPTVTINMPNGHKLTFEAKLSDKEREAVVQEYWNIVKAEANRMQIRHILLWLLWFIVPVGGLYGLGWSLGWVYRGSKERKQKAVLLVGVGIIVVMGLIPPWHSQIVLKSERPITVTVRAGYGFLFSPPYCPKYAGAENTFDEFEAPSIALSQLFVQWIVVAIAAAGILFGLRGSHGDR